MLGLGFFAACGEDEETPPNPTGALTSETSLIYWDNNNDGMFDGKGGSGTEIPSSKASIIRASDRVMMTMSITGAPPGTAMTAWFHVFNNPDKCTDAGANTRCGEADLTNAAVDASILFAGTGLVAADGKITFAGAIKVGDATGAEMGAGLKDEVKADIHVAVRSHGIPDPLKFIEQMTTYNGGCTGTCKNWALAIGDVTKATAYAGVEDPDHTVYYWDKNANGKNDTLAGEPGLTAWPGAEHYVFRTATGIDVIQRLPPGSVMPGKVFSFWIATFRNYDQCLGGCKADTCTPANYPRCGSSDFMVPESTSSRIKVSTTMSRPDGSLQIAGHLDVGDKSGANVGDGLVDPFESDIHAVFRDHSALMTTNTASAAAQFRDFNGGCMAACPNITTAHAEVVQ
jgi:hypothetical protein